MFGEEVVVKVNCSGEVQALKIDEPRDKPIKTIMGDKFPRKCHT